MAPGAAERARTVMLRCDLLGALSEEPGRLTRPFATRSMRAANELVSGWMREVGLTVRQDAIGNLIGRLESDPPGLPALVLGSHLDTVRGAGRYDGPLGVLAAIAAVEALPAAARSRFAVEVVAFADEEGLRFAAAYLGSRVLAGVFPPADLERTDAAGVTMAEAIRAFGGDPDAIPAAAADPARLLGYLEVHIEQGPVLEREGLPLGVVEAIAGQTRFGIEFTGMAGHAGTVPPEMRRDALAAAAELVLAAEAEARSAPGLVATVGRLEVRPNAANVIPGSVALSLDVRHADDTSRAESVDRLLARLDAISRARHVPAQIVTRYESPATRCAPGLSGLLADAVAGRGHAVRRLASGAGHDAIHMSKITPSAMLFVRCRGGVSHHPDEAVETEDVAAALEVVGDLLERLAAVSPAA